MAHTKDNPLALQNYAGDIKGAVSADAEPPNTSQLDTYERMLAENKRTAASVFLAMHERRIETQRNAREAYAALQRRAKPRERPPSTPHLDRFRQLTDAGKLHAAGVYSAMHTDALSKEREEADAFDARDREGGSSQR